MSATIDGVRWTATESAISVVGNSANPVPGTLSVTGIDISNGSSVSLLLGFIAEPGTYPLGVNPLTNAGGIAQVSRTPQGWSSPLSGDAGTVMITTRTASRIAGTFEFTAANLTGGGADTEVTAGRFDITLSGGLPALPTDTPSHFAVQIDGAEWRAATVTGVSGGGSFTGSTMDFSVTFVGRVPLETGVAYRIGADLGCSIIRTSTNESWAPILADSVGFVTFVTRSETRLEGTFGGTIPGVGTAAPLSLEKGVFSIRIM